MQGTALIYRPGARVPEETALAVSPPLEFLQKAVGGYIEEVPFFNSIEYAGAVRPCVCFCDEEGKLKRYEVNIGATLLWDQALRRLRTEDGKPCTTNGLVLDNGTPADVLCGAILVLVGDAEFLGSL